MEAFIESFEGKPAWQRWTVYVVGMGLIGLAGGIARLVGAVLLCSLLYLIVWAGFDFWRAIF